MNDKLFKLNIAYAIVDTLIGLASIGVFGYLALFFSRWWIGLFSIIPLLVYNSHTLVIDADIQQAKRDALEPGDADDDR